MFVFGRFLTENGLFFHFVVKLINFCRKKIFCVEKKYFGVCKTFCVEKNILAAKNILCRKTFWSTDNKKNILHKKRFKVRTNRKHTKWGVILFA